MTVLTDDRHLLALLPEQQFTSEETAKILGICKTTVWRLTERGELPAIGSGRLKRYALRDIRAYQERHRR
jgi:excisionase family DNA binding protein